MGVDKYRVSTGHSERTDTSDQSVDGAVNNMEKRKTPPVENRRCGNMINGGAYLGC